MNKKITLALLATLVCAMQLLAAPGKIRNASITQDASCTGPGNPNEKILQIMLGISGDAVNLKSIDFTLDGTTDLNDYKKVKVYYNGTDPLNRFDERNAEGATLLGEYDPQPGTMTCDLTTDISLSGRFNYFYIVAEVADDAKEGKIKRVDIQGRRIMVTPQNGAEYVITSPGDIWMVDDLRKAGVQVYGKAEEEPSFLTTLFVSWFPMILLIGAANPRPA